MIPSVLAVSALFPLQCMSVCVMAAASISASVCPARPEMEECVCACCSSLGRSRGVMVLFSQNAAALSMRFSS